MLIRRPDGKVDLQLTIPDALFPAVTYGIYKEIAERIEANDPLAKELVDWYATNIGLSANSLKQALQEKEANKDAAIHR